MKRELAFALEAQSQFGGYLGRTRASKVQNGVSKVVSENSPSSTKRVEGFAVNESVSNGSLENLKINGLICDNQEEEENSSHSNENSVDTRNKRLKIAIETVSKDEIGCNLATPTCEIDNGVDLAQASVMEETMGGIENGVPKEGDCGVVHVVVNERKRRKKDVRVNALRRLTRSASKLNAEAVEGLVPGPIRTGELDGGNSEAVVEIDGNETGANGALEVREGVVENVGEDVIECNLATPICEIDNEVDLAQFASVVGEPMGVIETAVLKEGDGGVAAVMVDKRKKVVSVISPRRFTRSALKADVEPMECVVAEPIGAGVLLGGNSEAVLEVEGNETGEISELGTATNELELKTSKKIEIMKKPTTVRELFKTGLFEGYSVFYNGGNKGNGLMGVVKGTGILCSCDLCKGCKVVTPCQFEIHACKSYRRATQYICLENGKSLLEVLKICKRSSLDTLEETIQCAISSSPLKESVICQNCKVFPSNQFCESCLELKDLQASPTHTVGQSTRSSKSASVLKSSGSVSVHISSQKQSRGKITKRLSKSVVIPRKSASLCMSPEEKKKWKITTKDQKMHKLVFEEGGLPDGTELAYYSNGQKLLRGYKKGLGIYCFCCRSEVSASTFEAHAGWATRRKPYGYIYTSNGVSLHELAISLLKGRVKAAKDNDDLCIICADGGDLLLCDGCPRAFHIECASLTSIPRGKWYCNYCQNMFQREKFVEYNANAVAAGRISGVDPIEQITKRCIRIIKNAEEAEVIACVLCRGYDFSKSGFGALTVILCDQCEKEYHVGCLKKYKMADLKELPKGKWFCSMDCQRIYIALQDLLIRGEEKLPDSLSDVLKKKHEDKDSGTVFDFDVRWRLLSGKIAPRESRLLLSKAVAIFHECFDPIVDLETGQDFIPSMVYGRNLKGQDYGGMYCAVLTVNSTVVSAAIFRIFGCEVAELPLVATSNAHQGKGYFQMLFTCIERLLAFLKVRTFVLPAAEEAESIWMKKFGFERIPSEQLNELRKDFLQTMTFKGTAMLQKRVPQCRIIA